MTLDLAAIDRELDALAAGLAVSEERARAGAETDLVAVDAALAELESGVFVVAPRAPQRAAVLRPATVRPVAVPAPLEPVEVEEPSSLEPLPVEASSSLDLLPVEEPPLSLDLLPEEAPVSLDLLPVEEAPVSLDLLPVEETPLALDLLPVEAPLSEASLFGDEESTGLLMDISLPDEFAEAPALAASAPLGEDALFGDEPAFPEPAAEDLGGLDFEDSGQRVSVPDDLAALLEGELDPSEFGPPTPRASYLPEPAADADADADSDADPDADPDAEASDVAFDDGDVELMVDDAELYGAPDGTEPLPSTDTSLSTPPAPEGAEVDPAGGGEKKGFFRKIFGK